MNKSFLQAGALFGMLAVILGAFGAHAIKEKVTPDALAIYETGVRYMMYHAIALLATGILAGTFSGKCMKRAGYAFIIGIILFSGSLFLLTYFKATGNDSLLWFGAVTPFGGAAFIAGWVCLLVAFFKDRSASASL